MVVANKANARPRLHGPWIGSKWLHARSRSYIVDELFGKFKPGTRLAKPFAMLEADVFVANHVFAIAACAFNPPWATRSLKRLKGSPVFLA